MCSVEGGMTQANQAKHRYGIPKGQFVELWDSIYNLKAAKVNITFCRFDEYLQIPHYKKGELFCADAFSCFAVWFMVINYQNRVKALIDDFLQANHIDDQNQSKRKQVL